MLQIIACKYNSHHVANMQKANNLGKW